MHPFMMARVLLWTCQHAFLTSCAAIPFFASVRLGRTGAFATSAAASAAASVASGRRDGSVGYGRFPIRDEGIYPQLDVPSMVSTALSELRNASNLRFVLLLIGPLSAEEKPHFWCCFPLVACVGKIKIRLSRQW